MRIQIDDNINDATGRCPCCNSTITLDAGDASHVRYSYESRDADNGRYYMAYVVKCPQCGRDEVACRKYE